MDSSSTFSFKFQSSLGAKYLVFGIAGFILLPMLSVFVFDDGRLIIGCVIIAVILFGLGIFYFIKNSKGSDSITFEPDGFHSEFHGRVGFNEIDTIKGYGILGAPPPSMKMILKSGKKLIWYFSPTKSIYNTEEDVSTFFAFTDALEQKMQNWQKKDQGEIQSQIVLPKSAKPLPETPTEHPIAQLRKVKKGFNRKPLIIPVAAIFGLLIFVRTCGEDFFEKKRNRDVQKIFQNSEKSYQNNLKKLPHILDEYTPKLGAIYLFSNDLEIDVKLLPEITENRALSQVPVLSRADLDRQMRHLIKYPDSAVFKTALIHSDSEIQFMRTSMMNYGDTSKVMLYLRFFDPERKINPLRMGKEIDSSQYRVFDFYTGVNPYPVDSLRFHLQNSIPGLRMMLAQLNHSTSMKMYLTGAEKDEIPKSLFLQTVAELKQLMTEAKVDTSVFNVKTFNK